jgi:hypothetical protein
MANTLRVLTICIAALLMTSALGCAETDRSTYTAGETGISTFLNSLSRPVFLPGCAPFVIQRRVAGDWVDVGPPFVCVWEGIAVRLEQNESVDTPFQAPPDTGTYRNEYSVSAGCEPDLPLSQANCQIQHAWSTAPYRVERELCDPGEFACRFVPGAPNYLCEDGIHVGGPSGECTRDPSTGRCGYEFIDCP